ncbi:MAG: aspartyl/asparaginyl beta-hydroxylase domain-containing protein [Nostoc sp.]|uniref:aspartyl/asparaginyl beta-hydroxylase domain-containing protein n=1 Tax=Nostoc sp. TaxID=1180 RepID=UPI002FFA33B2
MFQQNYTEFKFLFRLLKILKFLYPKGNIHHVEDSLKSYIGMTQKDLNLNQPMGKLIYSGITHKPWYESYENDVLSLLSKTLEKRFDQIESEWLGYLSSDYKIIPKYKPSDIFGESLKNQDEDWQYYLIWRQGKFTKAATSLFPNTVKIISELNPFLYSFGEVVFINMKPGVILPPHTDDINISLTCHLGIQVPENCGINVGGETRSWSRGKTLFFDNSFEHGAWNKSHNNRIVLLIDLYHPELTKVEKYFLKFILKYFVKSEFHGINNSEYQKKLLDNLITCSSIESQR